MAALHYLRWRIAAWIAPGPAAALTKRQLERLCMECGTNKVVATKIASTYFKRLHDGQ